MKEHIKPNQCCKRVWEGFHDYQCTRTKNLVERDGMLYCKQHDPVEVKRRKDERQAQWEVEWKAREEGYEQDHLIHATYPKLVELAKVAAKLLRAPNDQPLLGRFDELVEQLKADGLDIGKE